MDEKKKPKSFSKIDSMIIDLILDHYNVQSFTGLGENLSGDKFMELVDEAEKMYYQTLIQKYTNPNDVAEA